MRVVIEGCGEGGREGLDCGGGGEGGGGVVEEDLVCCLLDMEGVGKGGSGPLSWGYSVFRRAAMAGLYPSAQSWGRISVSEGMVMMPDVEAGGSARKAGYMGITVYLSFGRRLGDLTVSGRWRGGAGGIVLLGGAPEVSASRRRELEL